MRKQQNITYYLGAGASFNAIPILNSLGNKMIELARLALNVGDDQLILYPYGVNDETNELLYDIGYFGKKALEYTTIDIYAKKLFLNKSVFSQELQRLKIALSAFFTIWQLTDDPTLKTFGNSQDNKRYSQIDERYLKLMSTILENNEKGEIAIKENIKFITWNYDLQLESSFKKMLDDDKTWDDLSNCLNFGINSKRNDVCHLNGYNGFYKTKNTEKNILERTKSRELKEIIEAIKFITKSQREGTIDFSNHIRYAWEDSDILNYAEQIMKDTEILVIIGYSFPDFNSEIDSKLFKTLVDSGKLQRIYYQSLDASEEFLRRDFNIPGKRITKDDHPEVSIDIETKNMSKFIF